MGICLASTSASDDAYEGVLTGKGLTWGGSLVRTEATGYGLLYFCQCHDEDRMAIPWKAKRR